ncbi:hypothetical protein K488DRAFT_83725 [Vararia minispora EC-137]|uniref:Uncharacterized protein n=1 Tax=Vararia minispora EC-137 TaxID=1314806 RepID=A0ACB8QRZ5_9AGAM|nr:hypothetical protein K488DRAFT_83725 [Vararia minispora EC-137]
MQPVSLLRPRATSSSVGGSTSSSGLSGRSLAILITFICLFFLIVAFGYARRNAHTRALAHANAPGARNRGRRHGQRPALTEVRIDARPAAASRGTWRSMQPLSARVNEPDLRAPRPPRPRTEFPPPPIPRAGGYVQDYNAIIGDAWFGGRNLNEVPEPPRPRPPRQTRHREPTMHVAVLIAMPTPHDAESSSPTSDPSSSTGDPSSSSVASPMSPGESSSHARAATNAHDRSPQRRQAPPNIALGVVRLPWRQREDTAVWNLESTIGILT